jgi:colanic acid biosynthesis glycosyl transferase WcaI
MKILIVSQLYAPEMGAQSNRIGPFARHLAASGHEVYVATGMPNYPTGKVFPAYTGKRFMAESVDGVTILRTAYLTAPRNQSRLKQLASYLSFACSAFAGGLRAGKPDVVFVTSPPLFSALPAMALARRSRARLVLDLRDLWPDEIIACGAAGPNSASVRLMRQIERRAYRRADCVCCTTESFRTMVVERGVPVERTMLLPNGADLTVFREHPRNNAVAAEYPLQDRFVAMYSGLLGIKHGLEALLQAAKMVQDEPRILFFMLGSGARRDALEARAASMGLKNVLFGGERKVEDIPYLLSRADVCLSMLLPDPYLENIISVKLFEYMACARPIVAGCAGESARVLEASRAGIAVPAGDSEGMARGILKLMQDSRSREEMGRTGRRFVEENYSRSAWAQRLEQRLCALCA